MVLVSIVGDFHSSILPIYYQMANKINKHIIVYDDYKHDVNEAKSLVRGIKKFNKKHKLDIKNITYCIDEDSLSALESLDKFIKENTKKKDEVYINTTDGLSNINSYLSKELVPLGFNFISYDRFDNEANILSKDSMKTYHLDKTIPIQDHFLLRDIDVQSVADKKFVKKNKTHIVDLFEEYSDEFKLFANYVQQNTNPNLTNKKYKNINKIMKRLEVTDPKKRQGFITGGLFECYIYLKLSELSFDDIEIGLIVNKYIDENNFIPNEFDILIMKDNHLHMVECKYTKKIKLDSIVYKYMGLKSLLDDDGKICIVTGHKNPKNIKESKNPVEHLPYKRAMANKIMLRGNPLDNIDDFISEVENFFGLK